MKSKIVTRVWVSAFALIVTGVLAGCGSAIKAPEAGTYFRDYPIDEATTFKEHEAPPIEPDPELRGDVYVFTEEQFIVMEKIIEHADEYWKALGEREKQIQALEIQRAELVRAGAATEARLELVGQMYENEARECQWIRLSSYGIAGASFLILGIGSL